MSHLPLAAAATLISEETRELIRAQDDTLLANQMLFVSVLKTARDAPLAFKDKQKVFSSLHANTTKMLDARWAVGDTLALLRTMAPDLGVETVLEGCATSCPVKPSATLSIAPVAEHEPMPPVMPAF